ncbi:AMP-binding protein [Mesorhizobium sp. B2-4-13]|uniref:AMP-binding protein n=1 Tax=Mesorhizobium sp. B2-4-13 TaxID=2589936 RepID=UPI00115474F7|nr:AMP-binding protein [Mesorhizobium sp. B2-4-13]TPK79092.1 AMP-binding protein [Mesorhizobium sp. B2-4-13]
MQQAISETLVQIARDRASRLGDKVAYANLRDGKEEQRRISYRQLDESCRLIGAALQRRNAAGERVLLLFPQGAEFVLGFFGTLYGGAIAVPAHTPKPNKRSWATFEAIVADCKPRFILTCHAIRDNIVAWSKPYPTVSTLELLCVEDLEKESSVDDWDAAAEARTDIAFLQYTSGSTSTPKGVMVSHANLIHNARLTARHMGHDEDTVIVSWLPLFHDLGLIGIVIQTLYVGATCYMMSPAAFSGNPALWLQAISRYRATSSMSSDFGYRLCVKSIRPEQLEGVDLSSWRNALNAAEPIHASTLASFQEKFAPFGFAEDAFFPAYGLAEATLLSTTSRVGEKPVVAKVDKAALARGIFIPTEDADAVELVSSGRPADDMEVAIIDPETQSRCADGAIGEVWVRGASIARGYWQAPDASRQTFAQSPAEATEPHFLRTGDLGFLWNKELFIAGRLKDLIISRGRNIYPQDIELTVKDSHPAFRTVNGAAFSVERDDGETIVVVHEIERTARNAIDLAELEKTVRSAVWQEHDASLAEIVFIPPASLPKTTSGKVQRRLTKALYLSGELPLLKPRVPDKEPAMAAPAEMSFPQNHTFKAGELQQRILAEARALVGSGAATEPTDSFGAIGIDSVMAAQLAVRLNDLLSLTLEPTIFWQYQTPQLLARHLAPEPATDAGAQRPTTRSKDELLRALKVALGEPVLEKQE